MFGFAVLESLIFYSLPEVTTPPSLAPMLTDYNTIRFDIAPDTDFLVCVYVLSLGLPSPSAEEADCAPAIFRELMTMLAFCIFHRWCIHATAK
jgi:hypothetical protein